MRILRRPLAIRHLPLPTRRHIRKTLRIGQLLAILSQMRTARHIDRQDLVMHHLLGTPLHIPLQIMARCRSVPYILRRIARCQRHQRLLILHQIPCCKPLVSVH